MSVSEPVSDQRVSDQRVSDQPEGPARPHREDEMRQEQLDAAREDRRRRAEGDEASEPDTGPSDQDQSAYSTEVEQGAAQPGPDDGGVGRPSG